MKSMGRILSNNKTIIAVMVVFGFVFGLLSFTNHFNFRTYCLDLGVYSHAIYRYAHLQSADCAIYLWNNQNLFADHFDLYLPLLSPLYWLFGQYTLLVVQIVFALLGGLGTYKFICTYTDKRSVPLLSMIGFYGFFGLWHALSFDYHTSVVATMLVPWLFYAIRRQRYGWGLALVVLISIGKETMPIWLVFITLALLWDYRKDKVAFRWLTIYCILSVLLFVGIALWVMPCFGTNEQVLWRYSYMGHGFKEMAAFMVAHPMETLSNFFTNFTHDSDYDGLKLEFWLCTLASGLFLVVRKPHWLLMLVPVVGMKMLARDAGFWGISNQYNVELTPVIVCGSYAAICSLGRENIRPWCAVAATLLVLVTTLYSTSNPCTNIRKDNVRVFASRHYRQRDFSTATAREMMAQIPDDASVCATTMFVPHLAMRDSVYMFPIGLGSNAEYYLLKLRHWCYYEGEEDKIAEMVADTSGYRLICTDGDLVLLKQNRR